MGEPKQFPYQSVIWNHRRWDEVAAVRGATADEDLITWLHQGSD